jgi:hypothetical protein
MNRTSFNPWMVDLGPEDFSCALAALSVLQSGGWGAAYQPTEAAILDRVLEIARQGTGVLACQPCVPNLTNKREPPAPARDLAEAWKRFVSIWGTLRLEISASENEFDWLWLASEFSRPAVGATSVYFGKAMLSPNERWHWPLRLGLLADEPSKALAAAIEQQMGVHLWAKELLAVAEIAGSDQRCDVLLLPHILPHALAHVLEFAPGLTASCVILCKGLPATEQARRLLGALEEEVRTNALAVLSLDSSVMAAWFVDGLLRSISHDQYFDVALAESLKKLDGPRSQVYLAANREWIQKTRLSHMAATLMECMARPEVSKEVVDIDGALAGRLGMPKGVYPVSRTSVHELKGYIGESHEATTLAYLTKAVAPSLRRNAPPPPQRQLQAQVFTAGSPSAAPEGLMVFRADTVHRVDVRIGVTDETWISSPDRFPDEELPPSKSGHRLTVVFSEPVLSPQPQVGHIFLPPTGSSTACSFFLAAADAHGRVQARISVLYRNRVLQTSMLEGPIRNTAQRFAEGDAISFLPEAVVSPGMSDLDRQSSYGAALVISQNRDGCPQVLKVVDDGAELVSTGNLMPSVQQIEDELDRCDWGAGDFSDLKSSGTLKLLRFLAVHGSLLYRGVVKQQFMDQSLARATSLQLIAAKPGTRLPVEYFYDRTSPNDDAELCPSAAASMTTGECAKACTEGANGARYVCPLGFWGLTRVLEWHIYRPQAARELQNHDYALQQEKLGRRHQLGRLDQAVFAASDRANAQVKTSVPHLLAAMRENEIQVTESPTWENWKKDIAEHKPSLLIVVPHLDIDSTFNVAKLEIGSGQWLRVDQVDEAYIQAQGCGCQPVVLLLGCETGKQGVPFEDFVSAFSLGGAAVVVSTSSLILGRQATLLAEEFVSVLHDLRAKDGATFGDVMLSVRRNMLRKGYPMVLSVSSYGDADWRL